MQFQQQFTIEIDLWSDDEGHLSEDHQEELRNAGWERAKELHEAGYVEGEMNHTLSEDLVEFSGWVKIKKMHFAAK